MANQSSPSDLGQTRKHDLGDGTYVWQRLNSVTGQWENFGQPIPYQTNTAGEAIKPENYESVTTPNGTTVAFGNVADPVVKYTTPVILPTSDKLVTEQRDFTGAGGQNNVQIGLISTVKGYEYTPDIGRLSVMDKNRYIPAEVAIGGGITAQGYIDLQTRMFDYAFKTANIDWSRPGNPNYKPNYSSMKLYTDTGTVSGAVSTGNGLMFGVNIPDPSKIDIGTRKVEAQTVRAGLILVPDSVKALENTLSPYVKSIVDYAGNAINPPVTANATAMGGRNWTMEDVNAGRISQHDYMMITGKTTPIQAFSKYLESKTAGTSLELPAMAFSMAPMFAIGGGEVGVAKMSELGVGKGILGRAIREGSFDKMISPASPLRTDNWYTFGKITPPQTTVKTVAVEDKALEQWGQMTTSERIISRSVVRDINAEIDLSRMPQTVSEPVTSAMPGKYNMISRIVNRDVMAEQMAADIRLNYGMENSGYFFTRFDETGAITMRNAVNHDYMAVTPQLNMVNHHVKTTVDNIPAWAQPRLPAMQHVTVEGTRLRVTTGIIGTAKNGITNITANVNDIINKFIPESVYVDENYVVPTPKYNYTPTTKPPEPVSIPDINFPVPPPPPSIDWKPPNYPFGIPPYLSGSGRGFVDLERAIGKAYRINIMNPFATTGKRKRVVKAKRRRR